MKNFLNLFFAVIFILVANVSKADNLVGARYSILISENKKLNTRSFKFCDYSKEKACNYIGKANGYSPKDLQEILRNEKNQAKFAKTGSVVASIVLIGLILYFIPEPITFGSVYGIIESYAVHIAAIVGGSFLAILGVSVIDIGPEHQKKQANVLKINGLSSEENIEATDEEIFEAAKLLKEILIIN